MSRKDTLRTLLSARDRRLTPQLQPSSELPTGNLASDSPAKTLVRSGAVGAMGRSLGRIADAAETAREEVRALIGSGTVVVDLDPSVIEVSFVSDRFDLDPAEISQLAESIREHGQQVPVLARPHPTLAGRYQLAYGHRRLRAAASLSRTVRAVVRKMSDSELVVAQGQENTARLDLSYIERAHFAMALEDRGFARPIIMAALTMEKTQLSRMISIGRAIPVEIVQAVRAAPKAGRPRWSKLAAMIEGRSWSAILAGLKTDSRFASADSDGRLSLFEDALKLRDQMKRPSEDVFASEGGAKIARIARGTNRLSLSLDRKVSPAFVDYLIERLPEFYRAFKSTAGQGV